MADIGFGSGKLATHNRFRPIVEVRGTKDGGSVFSMIIDIP
jgi:hypothetical protein